MPDYYGQIITAGAVVLILGLTYIWKRNEWFPRQTKSTYSTHTEKKIVDNTAGIKNTTEPTKTAQAVAEKKVSVQPSSAGAVGVTVLICAILFGGGTYYVLSGTSIGTQAATPATANVGDCLPDELFVMAPAKGDKFSDPISVWTDKPYPHVMRNDFNPNADVLFRMSDKSTQVAHKDGGVNLGYTKSFEFQSLDENEVGVVIHIWRCK